MKKLLLIASPLLIGGVVVTFLLLGNTPSTSKIKSGVYEYKSNVSVESNSDGYIDDVDGFKTYNLIIDADLKLIRLDTLTYAIRINEKRGKYYLPIWKIRWGWYPYKTQTITGGRKAIAITNSSAPPFYKTSALPNGIKAIIVHTGDVGRLVYYYKDGKIIDFKGDVYTYKPPE